MKNRAANLSPCERCGACCATFRVDFSIMDTQAEGGAVPDGLALPVTARTCRLRGTDHLPPRCAALSGRVGERVACSIYTDRKFNRMRTDTDRKFNRMRPSMARVLGLETRSAKEG